MTTLAHGYTIVHGEISLAEVMVTPVPRLDVPGPDVLLVPWRRVGVGATIGMLAGLTIGLLHSGMGAGSVFVAEVAITSAGLGILGSFMACMSSLSTRR